MRNFILPLILLSFVLSGCSLKLVPQPVESGVINSSDQSLTVTKGGLAITVRGAEPEMYSYNLDTPISAFAVVVDNQTGNEVFIDSNSFLLIDDQNIQHFPLTPEKVKELISKDSYYLIPYPYVGFYYLEDYEKSSFYNTYNSKLPYFYEYNPQDIKTKALSGGAIIPQAKVVGLVYFNIDLNSKKSVKLLVFKKGSSKAATPDFVFPFGVVK